MERMTIELPRTARALPRTDPISFIDPAGRPVEPGLHAGYTLPDAQTLIRLYRRMVRARRFESQVTALTRQGRMATYPSAFGQEACEVGAASALAEDDWMFPTYRDSAAILTRGAEPGDILSSFRGDWHCGYDPQELRTSPQATPLATQTLHAVGYAMAAKLRGTDQATLTFIGDGATSEGDAHEAFNFAAVWQTPTVFFIQNNQYAISVPLREQSNATMLADKAVGYGMPGVRVDGNDIAAVFAVVSAALERARRGEGPTLVEGLTYRLEAHTNSDDPTRYRSSDEVDIWRTRDPLTRLEAYLRAAGELDDEAVAAIAADAEELAAHVRELMNTEAQVDPTELFAHVYAHERPQLREQQALLEAELAAAGNAPQSHPPVLSHSPVQSQPAPRSQRAGA